MKCPRCGIENPEGANFCNGCGHTLQAAHTTLLVDLSHPRSYVPKHLAEKILTTRRAIEGKRKLVTVMFAHVAGFTSMSEKLEPEEVHGIMDGCLKKILRQSPWRELLPLRGFLCLRGSCLGRVIT